MVGPQGHAIGASLALLTQHLLGAVDGAAPTALEPTVRKTPKDVEKNGQGGAESHARSFHGGDYQLKQGIHLFFVRRFVIA